MGRRDVARALATGARAYIKSTDGREPTRVEALAALTEIAAGLDTSAGFDDGMLEDTPLRQLVAIAFHATPDEITDRDSGDGKVWANVTGRFSSFLCSISIERPANAIVENTSILPVSESVKAPSSRGRITIWDWLVAVAAIGVVIWISAKYSQRATAVAIAKPVAENAKSVPESDRRPHCQLVKFTIAWSGLPASSTQSDILRRCPN